MPKSLSLQRKAAATLLAVAAQKLFPGILLCGGRETSLGFYYDFIFPFPLVPEQLYLLEEEMRRLVKERGQIEEVEMVPKSAAALLYHAKQPILAELVAEDEQQLVTIARMGGYFDLQEAPFLQDMAEMAAFKLDGSQPLEEGIRIYGLVQENPQAIKEYIKKRKAGDHLQWGERQGLFKKIDEDLVLWLPKGVERRRELIDAAEALYSKEKFHALQAPYFISDAERLACHKKHGKGRSFEWLQRKAAQSVDPLGGLLDPSFFLTDRAFLFCGREKILEEITSSLQLLTESIKILGFGYRLAAIVQDGQQKWMEAVSFPMEITIGEENRIDLLVADRFGREWVASFLQIREEAGGSYCIIFSLFSALERTIALFLEREGETLRGKDAL